MLTSLATALALVPSAHAGGAWKHVAVSSAISVTLPLDVSPMTADQGNVPGQRVWWYAGRDATYSVSSRPLAEKDMAKTTPDLVLGTAVIDACNSLLWPHVKLQRDIMLNGWPGLDVLIVDDFGPAQAMRMYVVGQSLYTLCETYSRAIGRPAGVDKFMNSLVLNPAPSVGPLRTPGPTFTTFEPEGGRFSVGLPAAPKPLLTDPKIKPWNHFETQYGDRYYFVAYDDVPPDAPSNTDFQAMLQHAYLHGIHGKLLKHSSFVRDGQEYSTSEFTVTELLNGRLDTAIVAGRAYLVVMIYPTGHAGSKDIDEFFGSFRVAATAPFSEKDPRGVASTPQL